MSHKGAGLFPSGSLSNATTGNARPASINRDDFAVASSNANPISSSRSRIYRPSTECETCSFSAARETFHDSLFALLLVSTERTHASIATQFVGC